MTTVKNHLIWHFPRHYIILIFPFKPLLETFVIALSLEVKFLICPPCESLIIIMLFPNDTENPLNLALCHPLKVVYLFWTTVKTHLIWHFASHINDTDISF